MKRFAEGTSVPISRSREEVQRLLTAWRCRRIAWDDDFEEGRATNVLANGTGAVNVGACRVPTGGERPEGSGNGSKRSKFSQVATSAGNGGNVTPAAGRWPANVLLSHDPRCVEVGEAHVPANGSIAPGTAAAERRDKPNVAMGEIGGHAWEPHGNGDGTETVAVWACVPGCPVRVLDEQSGSRRGDRRAGKTGNGKRPEGIGDVATVKPVALMRWLARLVSPPGAIVLDPFAGSGTTGVACEAEGFDCVMIENEEPYAEIARKRVGL